MGIFDNPQGNYYGDLKAGGQGWNANQSMFSNITDASYGGQFYNGMNGINSPQGYGGSSTPGQVTPMKSMINAQGAQPMAGVGAGAAAGSANAWTGNMGYLGAGASILGAGINAYTGLKGLGLAEDQFEFNKDSWEKNFAMMQDQYYRKLNRGRSNAAFINGGYKNADAIREHYDSGTNLEGSANAWNAPATAPVNGPTVANAEMSASGSPFNLATKQAAMGAPGVTPLATPTNPAIAAGMGAPATAAGTALQNTSIGPRGTIKKRVKKRNPQNSNDNANDSEVTS